MNTDYFEQNNEMEKQEQVGIFGQKEEVTMLDESGLGRFTEALSGKTDEGDSKTQISYQSYCFEAPEDDMDKNRVYTLAKASAEISIDKKNPGFFVIDIIFPSYNDPELKLFWARFQNHRKNIAKDPNKTWIFYINIMEKASISVRTEGRDVLVMGSVFNPLIGYLTREVPNQLIEEDQERRVRDENGTPIELQGGNIVRLLVADSLVQFQIRNDIDTQTIKGEVEREEEEKRFINEGYQSDDIYG